MAKTAPAYVSNKDLPCVDISECFTWRTYKDAETEHFDYPTWTGLNADLDITVDTVADIRPNAGRALVRARCAVTICHERTLNALGKTPQGFDALRYITPDMTHYTTDEGTLVMVFFGIVDEEVSFKGVKKDEDIRRALVEKAMAALDTELARAAAVDRLHKGIAAFFSHRADIYETEAMERWHRTVTLLDNWKFDPEDFAAEEAEIEALDKAIAVLREKRLEARKAVHARKVEVAVAQLHKAHEDGELKTISTDRFASAVKTLTESALPINPFTGD